MRIRESAQRSLRQIGFEDMRSEDMEFTYKIKRCFVLVGDAER
jgi:hypothetical protein